MSLRTARNLVGRLSKLFEPGSTVCLHLANDVLYPVLVLAIWSAGCRWTGTNPAYTVWELEHHFSQSQVEYIIAAERQLKTVKEACERLSSPAEIIVFSDLLADVDIGRRDSFNQGTFSENDGAADAPRTLRSLLYVKEVLSGAGEPVLQFHGGGERMAALMQTSGTTGLPKLAARTHTAMILESLLTADSHSQKPHDVRRLCCAPIFHGFCFPEIVINALRLGVTTYIMKRFDQSFAANIQRFGITETFAAPPMLQMLVNDTSSHAKLQSLRIIYFGGAPLVPELRENTKRMFDTPPHIVPVYGMTEGGWFTTLKYPETDDSGSVGRPLPGIEISVRLLDDLPRTAGRNAGELLVRGRQIMSGYFNNDRATREVIQDQWLRTGDLAYIEDGKVFIIGRCKELIKTNGWAVAPVELENAVLQIPGVIDAAAFAIGCGVEEHAMICIVRRTNRVTPEVLKTHLLSRLARYKVSRCEFRFVEGIPRSAAGKILRKVLKASIAVS